VHDEKNETKVGDRVKIMETRPLSRLKRWRIVAVVESSAGVVPEAITEADVAAQVPTKAIPPVPPAEASQSEAKADSAKA